jgi:DNA-binding transcriptional ArsR family regulator
MCSVVSGETVHFIGVLAHPGRLLILLLLCKGEFCVGEIEEMTEIHQPTLSRQLSVLRKEGLATTRRDGRRICYAVARARL